MKIFKKLLTVLTAGTMAFTMAAFAACAPMDPDDDDKTGGGNLPAVGVDPSEPNAELLNGVLTQQYVAMSESMTYDQTTNYKMYELNDDGTKGDALSGVAGYGYREKSTQTAKVNLADGDMDVTVKDESTALGGEDNETRVYYGYNYLRDWHMFSGANEDESKPVTDVSKLTLHYSGNMMGEMPFDFDELGGMSSFYNLGLSMENFTVLALGNYFGGLTVEGNTATVDMNKVAFNLATRVNKLLGKVDQDTTIGELLADDTIKSVLSSVLGSVPADTVVGLIQTVVAAVPTIGPMLEAMGIDLSTILVAPNKGESTYDYLVRLINSNELKNAINTIIKAVMPESNVTLPTTLGNMTVDFFLNLAGTNVDEIKAMVKEYTENITATTCSVTVYSHYGEDEDNGDYGDVDYPSERDASLEIALPSTTSVTNAKVVFTLDNNKVTKQVVTANVAMDVDSLNDNGEIKFISNMTGTFNVNATVDYSSEKYTLANIDGCKTIEEKREYKEDERHVSLRLSDVAYILGADNITPDFLELNIKSVVNNGTITGYMVKLVEEPDSAYKALGDTYTYEVSISRWDDATGEYVNEDITLDFDVEKVLPEFSEDGYPGRMPEVIFLNREYGINDYCYFDYSYVYYGNTVAGILGGKPSTLITENAD